MSLPPGGRGPRWPTDRSSRSLKPNGSSWVFRTYSASGSPGMLEPASPAGSSPSVRLCPSLLSGQGHLRATPPPPLSHDSHLPTRGTTLREEPRSMLLAALPYAAALHLRAPQHGGRASFTGGVLLWRRQRRGRGSSGPDCGADHWRHGVGRVRVCQGRSSGCAFPLWPAPPASCHPLQMVLQN